MRMETPLVSVVVPNHNRERALALCVASVRAQTYAPIEIIVVDDCSTDGSLRVAHDVADRVLHTGANGGPAVARNLGAAVARGEILFFLDSDAALEPGSIAAAVADLLTRPRLGAVCGQLRPEPLVPRRRIQQYRALQLHCWFFNDTGRTVGFGLHAAFFGMRRAVFEQVGPLDPGLRHNEGPEYGHRLGRHGFEVCVSPGVQGRKDSDASLRIMLSKVYRRARAHAVGRDAGVPHAGRPARVAAGALTLAGAAALLPAPVLLGPAGFLVSTALLGGALLLDLDTIRFVVARRGWRFGLYFMGVHVLFLLTSAIGGALGVVQRASVRRKAAKKGARCGAAHAG